MFEDRTFENLMKECLEYAPPNIDTRQGSIFYDAVVANCMMIAQYYLDLKYAIDLVFVVTAVDEYLDRKGGEFNVPRLSATRAIYEFNYTGTAPRVGDRFFADSLFFTVLRSDEGALVLVAENAGIGSNNIPDGTLAVPAVSILGLTSATFGKIISHGTDVETDDNYRRRIQEKIARVAENGNRQHYKTWCESVDGVGRAYIVSLFAGQNTVMGLLADSNGLPASPVIVSAVQEYIDPITEGVTVEYKGQTITVGDGKGDGVANIGAHFYAVAFAPLNIKVEFNAELSQPVEEVREEAENAIKEYFKNLTLGAKENIVVRITAISTLLYQMDAILDCTDIKLNNGTGNLTLPIEQIPVLDEVIVNEIV